MKNLDKQEIKFLEDLIEYSNKLFGKGSRNALKDGIPNSDQELVEEFKLIIEKDRNYGQAFERLKQEGVIQEETDKKEMHKKSDDRNTRQIEERSYISLKEPKKVFDVIENKPEGKGH